ncbi:hypothetical protein PMAC_001002 [Pneumocystis sp. 'macacae']|nr:hypothetical protein PMAC_001002 [Pneumocystis sp. 'macacae']
MPLSLHDGSVSAGNLKRRTFTQHSLLKRQRLSEDSTTRRKTIDSDDHKRAQRFFGTLMGTLGKFQKESAFLQEKNAKRAEIEARLAECIRKEKEEMEERVRMEQDEKYRRSERLRRENLRELERMSLEAFYKSEIASAHALKTATLPVLFYLPWKLSPKEEEKARMRVEEAEEMYRQALRKLDDSFTTENSVYTYDKHTLEIKPLNHNKIVEMANRGETVDFVPDSMQIDHSSSLDRDGHMFSIDSASELIHDSKVSDHNEDMVLMNDSNMEDQCSICLSPFICCLKEDAFFSEKNIKKTTHEDGFSNEIDDIAHLGNCTHIFHHRCIRSWLKIANTCPVCRDRFYWIRLSRSLKGVIFKAYAVEDKVNSGNNDISDVIQENYDTCRCIICGSSEDEQVLLLCDQCDDAYHTYCLGLEEVPDTDFFCPTCITLSGEYLFHFSRRSALSGRTMRRIARQRPSSIRSRRRTNISVTSARTSAASFISSNAGARFDGIHGISLPNNWFQTPCYEDSFRRSWNVEIESQGSNLSSISLAGRTGFLYSSGKLLTTFPNPLSSEEKAWEMYEVQRSGEKFEKYKDSLFKDDFSSSVSQRKYKRPLIARDEIRDTAHSPKECIDNLSDDNCSIYAKGKAKENFGNQTGFLQNLLDDISNTSRYSPELNSDIQVSERCYNKVSPIGNCEKKSNSVFVSDLSSKTNVHEENSFQLVSDMSLGTQSKEAHHISSISPSSLSLSESFLAKFSSFSSKSAPESSIVSPGRKIAFTIKKKIEKIVSKELRLYYPEKISKDICKSINKRVCRMIYEDVALLGEHMFDDFNDIWYDKIKVAVLHLIKDFVHV